MSDMPERVVCDICGAVVAVPSSYVVRVDVFADPSVPPMSREEIEEAEPDKQLKQILAEMEGMSVDDLQDQVHRRFEYRICPACHPRFLANPLGLPRARTEGGN